MRKAIQICVWIIVGTWVEYTNAFSITGQVVDSKAVPVQGAEVAVYQKFTIRGMDEDAKEIAPIVKTDQKGAFEVKADVSSQYDVFIVARKTGYAYAWDGLNYSRNTLGKGHFLLVLEPPCTLAGQVVDPNGGPVAKVEVQVLPINSYLSRIHQRPMLGPKEWFTTTTDSQGIFRFTQFAADVSATFRVKAPGGASVYRFCTHEQNACGFEVWRTGIQLVLPREGTVKGRVQDGQGQPVSGVDLVIQSDRQRGDIKNLYLVRKAQSDRHGAFAFEGLPEGPHQIEVLAPEQGPVKWVGKGTKVSVKAGQAVEAVVPVGKGGTIEVTVLDAKTHRPLKGARVDLYGQDWRSNQPGLTDDLGIGRVRAPAGKYEAYAEADGYTFWRIPEGVVITEGRTERAEALLDPKPKATGRVLDAGNRPALDVAVGIHPFGDCIYTDTEGRFTAGYDERYAEKGGFAVARDAKSGLAAVVPMKVMSNPVEFQLGPAWILTGHVTDPNGVGLPAARVALSFHAQNCLSNLGAEVLTDPQGRFEIKAIPPVLNGFDYRISVNAAGFGPKEYERIRPEGKAGTTVDVGTIELPLADQTVSGVVVDANGAPASYVPIFINGLAGEIDHPSKSTATNDRGEFTITRICKGVIRLQANFSTSPGGQGFIRTQIPSQSLKIVLGKDLTQMPETSILGKALPNLAGLSKDLSEVKADNRPVLLCLVDIEQRPSRKCLSDLAKKTGALADKGVSVVVVQTSKVDLKQYDDFLKANTIGFPIHVVDGDFGAEKAQWGVKALPWLILTDKEHMVRAEGFGLDELDQKLTAITDKR